MKAWKGRAREQSAVRPLAWIGCRQGRVGVGWETTPAAISRQLLDGETAADDYWMTFRGKTLHCISIEMEISQHLRYGSWQH